MSEGSARKYRIIRLRRWTIVITLLWTILLCCSAAWNVRQVHEMVIAQATSEARAHFNKDTVYRSWASQHGGVYVPVTDNTPPNPYLAHVDERDLITPSNRSLTLVNPAYMTRQVMELSNELYGVKGHITSLNTIRPQNAPDPWEREVLQSFEEGVLEASSVGSMDNVKYLRFMRPFFIEQDCLYCHGYQGYSVGDIRGGISFSVPLTEYYALRQQQGGDLVLWHIILYCFGLAGIFFTHYLLRGRLLENEDILHTLAINQERFRSLLTLSQMKDVSEKELMEFALEEIIRLSSSEVGYFHFYDEEKRVIQLLVWSRKTMSCCTIPKIDKVYPLEKAGVWADCIRQGETVIHNDYQALANTTGLPDGHFPIYRHMSAPIMDKEEVVGIVGVGNKNEPYNDMDATQLLQYGISTWEIISSKRAEQQLAEREEELQLFREYMDQSHDLIFILDPEDGRFEDMNDRVVSVLGYQREELLKMGLVDIDTQIDDAGGWQELLVQMRHGDNFLLESVYVCKGGRTLPVEINSRIFTHGSQERLVAAVRDISERKDVEKQLIRYQEELEELVRQRTLKIEEKSLSLEESQRALQYLLEDVNEAKEALEKANVRLTELDQLKSMFIASMSHELRTPLNSVIGFSSILLQKWQGPLNEEQEKNLAIILRAGKHLLSLINDVIDISKIEAGALPIEVETFQLEELLDEAVQAVIPDAQEKGLVVELQSCSVEMHSDRRRLLQCVLNLLSNAVKFTAEGSIVFTARYDDTVEISVTDTGIGISKDDIPTLFRPFVRLNSPGQATYPGTGLGLYLTRKLVTEILGGTVAVTSEEGRGSRFSITIPLRIEE